MSRTQDPPRTGLLFALKDDLMMLYAITSVLKKKALDREISSWNVQRYKSPLSGIYSVV